MSLKTIKPADRKAVPNSYARIAAMRSTETVEALNALVEYRGSNPDPLHPDHAETLRRLQYAYVEAAKADGSFYAAAAEESDRWAAQAEALALDYPANAARYAQEAANHRMSAERSRALLAEVVNVPMARAA